MALVIHLKKGGQIIVNGAVLENASGRTISLVVKNDVSVLRGPDVLTPDAAVTPASRVYYALQCAYVFSEARDRHLTEFRELLSGYLRAAPSALPIAEAVLNAVNANNFYEALKKARNLIEHEGKVLRYVQERLVEELQDDPAAGQSPRH